MMSTHCSSVFDAHPPGLDNTYHQSSWLMLTLLTTPGQIVLTVKEKKDNVRNLLYSGRKKIVTCCKDSANRANHLAVSTLTEVTVDSIQEEDEKSSGWQLTM